MIDALFSSTLQRVLGLIYGQPDRRFFATEIIRLVDGGSGAVQRELARLVQAGLVVQEVIGRQKFYKANRHAPIFSELQQIVIKTVGLSTPLRDAFEPLQTRIKLALIFGSIAKGGETALSDIDLLVVSDELALKDLYEALAMTEHRLGRRINVTLYNSGELADRIKLKNPFVSKVLAGDYIRIIGEEATIGEIRRSRET